MGVLYPISSSNVFFNRLPSVFIETLWSKWGSPILTDHKIPRIASKVFGKSAGAPGLD